MRAINITCIKAAFAWEKLWQSRLPSPSNASPEHPTHRITAVRKRLNRISVNMISHKKITLLNVICTTKLCSQNRWAIWQKLYKLNVSVCVFLKTANKNLQAQEPEFS